mgnify:CR=1 FL=1
MNLQAFLWMVLPLFVAGGSALLAYYVMQARMEVALARERESLAEVRATLQSAKVTMEERIKATEEATRRAALDELMQDIRVEERSYVRETKSQDSARKIMVMQERIFFRNIPLSNWIEREMIVEEGATLTQLSAAAPAAFAAPQVLAAPAPPMFSAPVPQVFPTSALPPSVETTVSISRLLQEVQGAQEVRESEAPTPALRPAKVLLTQHATAFGAQ